VRQKEREEQANQVGYCRLCGVKRENIMSPKELGKTDREGGYFHLDHIVPKSKGGSDKKSNLRWLCWFCNQSRGNMEGQDQAVATASKAFWKALN